MLAQIPISENGQALIIGLAFFLALVWVILSANRSGNINRAVLRERVRCASIVRGALYASTGAYTAALTSIVEEIETDRLEVLERKKEAWV